MVEITWTDPALDQLEEFAEYIALDKPDAASNLVRQIFSAVERLEQFPDCGHNHRSCLIRSTESSMSDLAEFLPSRGCCRFCCSRHERRKAAPTVSIRG
ncbi:MAG: type II toxin-antitoxin system RelE/ParE family toxin [Pseudomonadota bacterium]